jgi:hypothetical protein
VVRHLAVVRTTPEAVLVAAVLVIAALNGSRSSLRYGWAASLPAAGDDGAEFCISARIRGAYGLFGCADKNELASWLARARSPAPARANLPSMCTCTRTG